MKAIMYHTYGGPEVLEVKDVNVPVLGPDDLLIANKAASITTADTMMRKGEPKFGRLFLGITGPKNPYLGTGFAGVVSAVGQNVETFKVGDEVYGETLFGLSASAAFVKVNAQKDVVQFKPSTLSFAQAANVCDGLLTSYNFLVNLANVQRGEKVLVIGASGALGTAAIQIATWKGANVTAVCSAENQKMVMELGALTVVDYKHQDFSQLATKFDVVYDTIGVSSYVECKNVLTKQGKYVTPVLSKTVLCDMIFANVFRKRKTIFDATGMKKTSQLNAFLQPINKAIQEQKLTVEIERTFKMEEIAQAHAHIDSGRKKGSVALVF